MSEDGYDTWLDTSVLLSTLEASEGSRGRVVTPVTEADTACGVFSSAVATLCVSMVGSERRRSMRVRVICGDSTNCGEPGASKGISVLCVRDENVSWEVVAWSALPWSRRSTPDSLRSECDASWGELAKATRRGPGLQMTEIFSRLQVEQSITLSEITPAGRDEAARGGRAAGARKHRRNHDAGFLISVLGFDCGHLCERPREF